ncbi:MAG: hypothetical protein WCP03_01020 [Candidatus Saccharibacteria bacterium]
MDKRNICLFGNKVQTYKMIDSKIINTKELKIIREQSIETLEQLIKPHGLYASNMSRWKGCYHHYFGRDTAITAIFIFEAEKQTGDYVLSAKILKALLALAKFQGEINNPESGEEIGKMPHEIVTAEKQIDQMTNYWQVYGGNPWYIDPQDKHIKSWDSVDSTPLWLVAVSNFWNEGWIMPDDVCETYIKAVKWCLDNKKNYHGFLGWTPTANQPGRLYGGLHNQTWKDSFWAFTYQKGGLPTYPLHDIYTNGAVWSAFVGASKVLKDKDKHLSKRCTKAAKELKKSFNKKIQGFRTKGFYAEALDGQLNQLSCPSVDVGLVLAFNVNGQCAIQKKYIKKVVKKLISEEFLDSELGLRTYPKNILNFNPKDEYHRGPNVFWPFAGALVAKGLHDFGYDKEANQVTLAMLKGVSKFDGFIELFIKNNGLATPWHNSETKQSSTLNQAWTAAGVYYGCNLLLTP